MELDHLLKPVITLLQDYPSLWPGACFCLFFPALLAVSRSRVLSLRLARVEPGLARICGLAGMGIFAFCVLTYLGSPSFFDFFESSGVSVAYTVCHGGVAFPGSASAERYSLPYGPILYLVLGGSQWLFGAGTFASKLPSAVAAILAIAIFWRILRRLGLPNTAACALAGLQATCVLGFRHVAFWAKSDSLISLAVMSAVWAALRPGRLGPVLPGACLGLGVGLKLTAAAYFLPGLVIAFCHGWRWRSFLICGAVGAALVLLPFVLLPGQFPWRNYVAFFRTVSHEGLNLAPMIAFFRWVAMLTGLVGVSDCLILQPVTLQSRRRRCAYRVALAGGIALTAIPASAVGSGPHHLMPFVALVLLSFGNLFAPSENRDWRYSAKPVWRAAAYAIFSGCILVGVQTAWRTVRLRLESDGRTRACETDLRQILASHPQFTMLMGTGFGDESERAAHARHLLVFAGNPIGLDAAVVSDYQFGGMAEPDLLRLLEEIRRHHPRPILWLLPRGSSPFTNRNWYDRSLPIYSDQFRRDFSQRFAWRENTDYFDLYFPAGEEQGR